MPAAVGDQLCSRLNDGLLANVAIADASKEKGPVEFLHCDPHCLQPPPLDFFAKTSLASEIGLYFLFAKSPPSSPISFACKSIFCSNSAVLSDIFPRAVEIVQSISTAKCFLPHLKFRPQVYPRLKPCRHFGPARRVARSLLSLPPDSVSVGQCRKSTSANAPIMFSASRRVSIACAERKMIIDACYSQSRMLGRRRIVSPPIFEPPAETPKKEFSVPNRLERPAWNQKTST